MKNLFVIAEDEKNRIINLHESATKKQYLNEAGDKRPDAMRSAIVDLTKGTLTLEDNFSAEHATGGDELKLFQGAKFLRTKNNNLLAKTKYQFVGDITGRASGNANSGTVVYYCSKGKFQVQGRTDMYYNENYQKIQKSFTELCKALPGIAKQQAQQLDQNARDTASAKLAGWNSVEEWKKAGYQPNPNQPKQQQQQQPKQQQQQPKQQNTGIDYSAYGI